MTEYSDDYKKGWFDGYQKAFDMMKHFADIYPAKYDPNKMPFDAKCSVCGMSFVDSMGRPIIMSYSCGNVQCPSKVTSLY